MNRIISLIVIFLSPITIWAQLEIPANNGDNVFEYEGFTLKYNEEFEQAEWVAYKLTADKANGDIKRTNNFREDPRVESKTASLDDYKGSGFDRGHLAPAGDMSWSKEAMSDSFYMSNMSPQDPWFNRVTWRQLEALVRDWAIEHDSIYIVTGPILTDPPYESIGENEIAIPHYYYKVILDYSQPNLNAIGFIFPNRRSKRPLSDFAVSVNFVEAITGIDFFHKLDDEIEEILESNNNFNNW
jgi:endonuclease G, mitochondrial